MIEFDQLFELLHLALYNYKNQYFYFKSFCFRTLVYPEQTRYNYPTSTG